VDPAYNPYKYQVNSTQSGILAVHCSIISIVNDDDDDCYCVLLQEDTMNVNSFGQMKQMLFSLYYKIKNVFSGILALDLFSSTCSF
jgi:hypothetical protein